MDDLDEALRLLMDVADIAAGDVAGAFFSSEPDEQWLSSSLASRIGCLVQWLLTEDRAATR
ncbi:hypothetical protein [Cupriavidus sp. WS]|uniref:hypothetical protein n=1 Tax=Cupriavidus sp. WS TaxID=1312922 RepID=UPI0012DCE611|nr:hypothetical protein [Cupriavidus sp. WS]